MRNLEKILNCRKHWRCNRFLSCSFCGKSWQRKKFKGFTQCLDTIQTTIIQPNTPMTQIVIRSNKLGTLADKFKEISLLLEELRELKKRGKLGVFYGRVEFSFSKGSLGFNPHLNLLVWGDYSIFKNTSDKLNLNFWSCKKCNDKNTAKSISWYMLKFNDIGIEKGEAVRKILNKKQTTINSKEFTFKNIDYIDEVINIDFSFMGVFPLRSKKEIELRAEHKQTLRELRSILNAEISKAYADMYRPN